MVAFVRLAMVEGQWEGRSHDLMAHTLAASMLAVRVSPPLWEHGEDEAEWVTMRSQEGSKVCMEDGGKVRRCDAERGARSEDPKVDWTRRQQQ